MVLEKLSLAGKTALITGASRGLGRGIAIALAQAGADIALVGRTVDGLEETAAAIESAGRRSIVIAANVAEVSEVRSTVASALGQMGRIDVLVNVAGTQVRKPALEVSEEDWDRLMAVNLKAVFFCCQAVAPAMIRQGRGKIINIASLTTKLGIPNTSIYGASKGGVGQMTKALAVEWAKYNINVNAIGPGYYKTQLTASLFADEQRRQELVRRIPMGRTGVPEDLAGTAVFLASEASDYITGQIIYVDGGWLAA